MSGTLMAKKKTGGRSPKNKERQEPGFRTVGLRVSEAYADWLAKAADHDTRTIAAFLDKAAASYAKSIGYDVPPPKRIP